MANKKGSPKTPKTPQPSKGNKPTPLRNAPKSEPLAKRKKLKEEIDDAISDEEFEAELQDAMLKEKAKKIAKDLKGESGGSEEDSDDIDDDELDEEDEDDDDLDDEDDSEGDDSEDDEDSEETPSPQKGKPATTPKAQQGKKQQQTPKQAQTSKKEGSGDSAVRKQAQTPSKQTNKSSTDDNKEYRDKCTLFVKGLPKNTTEADLKKLSKDIVDARIKLRKVTKSKRPILICQGYAYLHFASPENVQKNVEAIRKQTVHGRKITVDFVGEKGKVQEKQVKQQVMRLYVKGFGTNMTEGALKKLFPTCTTVILPGHSKHAFIQFDNGEMASEALNNSKNLSYQGKSLTVEFARQRGSFDPSLAFKRKHEESSKDNASPAKVQKTEKKQTGLDEEDEDDDDDDDEEDDDEEDDDEEEEESDEEEDDDEDDEEE